MNRELVAVKGDGVHWDIVYDVHHSEGQNFTTVTQVVNKITQVYTWLQGCEVIHQGDEIYMMTDSTTCVNPGTACKIN